MEAARVLPLSAADYLTFEETSDEGYATSMANDRFVIPNGAHWKDARDASRDVGRTLLRSYQAIEAANPERLRGVFGNAAWSFATAPASSPTPRIA